MVHSGFIHNGIATTNDISVHFYFAEPHRTEDCEVTTIGVPMDEWFLNPTSTHLPANIKKQLDNNTISLDEAKKILIKKLQSA